MRWKKFFLFVFILVSVGGDALSKVPPKTVQIPYEAIGVRTLHYFDESRSRPVVIELWYPTEGIGLFDAPEDPLWIHPKEMRNAAFRSGKFPLPLIVMSHGHRGDRRDRSWLADTLVRHGYAVASVEHFGDTRHDYKPLVSLRFWERPRDISFALDQLLNDPFLEGKIDSQQIGFVGYSLGGMTGLSLAGAIAENAKEAILKEAKKIEKFQAYWLDQVDFKEGEKSYKEPRIRAFLLLCPAIFIYPPDSLKKITAPIGLVAAINDEVLPHRDHAYQIIKHLVPTKLKIMRKEISHYSFLNPISEKGKKLLKKTPYKEPLQVDRSSLHKEIGAFAISFFEETLNAN